MQITPHDGETIARSLAARDGDVVESRRLFARIDAVARRTARRVFASNGFTYAEVDDVVQETLLAVHLKLRVWKGEHPLETWALCVARNKAIDVMRGAKAHRRRPIEDHEDELAVSFDEASDARADVARLMACLAPRAREIVAAIAIGGETPEDVARRLGLSNGAVRVALHRAIRTMGEASEEKTLH